MSREGAEDDGVYLRAAARLREHVIAALVAEVDQPHVVVCRSRRSGHVSLSGPYHDAKAAVCAAERERAAEACAGEAADLVFTVTPLHPPEADE